MRFEGEDNDGSGGGDAAVTNGRDKKNCKAATAVSAREYLPHLFWVSGDAVERREHRIDRFRALLDQQHHADERNAAERFFINFALQSRTETQMLAQLGSIHFLRAHFATVLRERNEELAQRAHQRRQELLDQHKTEFALNRSIADDVKVQDLQWFASRADAVRDAETVLIAKTCLDSVFSIAELAMSYSAYQEDIVAHSQTIPSPILEDLWTLFLTGSGVEKYEHYLRTNPSSSAIKPPTRPAANNGQNGTELDSATNSNTHSATTPTSGSEKHANSFEENRLLSSTNKTQAAKSTNNKDQLKTTAHGVQKSPPNTVVNDEAASAAAVGAKNISFAALSTEFGNLELQDFMRYVNRSGAWSAAVMSIANTPHLQSAEENAEVRASNFAVIPSATPTTAATAVNAFSVSTNTIVHNAVSQPGTAASELTEGAHPQLPLPNGGSGLAHNIFYGSPAAALSLNDNTGQFHQQPKRNELLGKFITDLINFRRKPITPPDHIAAPTAPIKIAILGKPLSGKTFLARYLSHIYGFEVINMQKLTQNYIRQLQILAEQNLEDDKESSEISAESIIIDNKLGEMIENELFSGEGLQASTAAALVLDAMKNRLTAGWILDGYPGTLTQARLLQRELNGFDVEKVQQSYERQTSILAGDQNGLEMPKLLTELLDLVIVIDVPDDEIADRIANKLYPTPKEKFNGQQRQNKKTENNGGDFGDADSESEASMSVLKKLDNNALAYNALHDRTSSFGTEYKLMEPVLMEFSCNVIHVDGRRSPEDLIHRIDSLVSARIQARINAYAEPPQTTATTTSGPTTDATTKANLDVNTQQQVTKLPSVPDPFPSLKTRLVTNSMQKYPLLNTIVVQSKPDDNTCKRGICDEQFDMLRRRGIHNYPQLKLKQPLASAQMAAATDADEQQKGPPAPVVPFPVAAEVTVMAAKTEKSSRSTSKNIDQQQNAAGRQSVDSAGINTAFPSDNKKSADRTFAAASAKPSKLDNNALMPSIIPHTSVPESAPKHLIPPKLTVATNLDDARRQYQEQRAAVEGSSDTPESTTTNEPQPALLPLQPASSDDIRKLLNYTSDQETSSFDLSSDDDCVDLQGVDFEARRRRKHQKQQSKAQQQQNTALPGSRSDSPRLQSNKAATAASADGAKAGKSGGKSSNATTSDATNKAIAATQSKKNDERPKNKGAVENVVPAKDNRQNRHASGRGKTKLFLSHCQAESDPLASDSDGSISSFSEDELDSSEYDFEDDFYTAFVHHNLQHVAPQQIAEANELREMAQTITNSDYNRRVVGYYHRYADELERWRSEREKVRRSRTKRKHSVMRRQSESDPSVRLAAYYTAHSSNKRSRRHDSLLSAYFPIGVMRIPAAVNALKSFMSASPTTDANNPLLVADTSFKSRQIEVYGQTPAASAFPSSNNKERRSSRANTTTALTNPTQTQQLVSSTAPTTDADTTLTSLSYDLDSSRGSQVLQLWHDIEAHYLSTTMRAFSDQRQVFRDIMVESYCLRGQFAHVLLAHQHQLRHPLFRYQARFNGIAPWKRVRSEFKAWMHHDVDNCHELMRETSSINRRKALEILFDMKASGWLEDRLGLVVNASVQLEQAELEFLVNIAFMLREYFNALCASTEFLDSETIYANVPLTDLLTKISPRSRTAGQGGSESMGSGSGSGSIHQSGALMIAGALMTSVNNEGVGGNNRVNSGKDDGNKQGGKKDAKPSGVGHSQSAHSKPGKNQPPVPDPEIQIMMVPRKIPPHLHERPNINMLMNTGGETVATQLERFAAGSTMARSPGSAAQNANAKSKSQNRISATTGEAVVQQTDTNALTPAGENNTTDNLKLIGGEQQSLKNGLSLMRDHYLGDADEQTINEATGTAFELLKVLESNEVQNVINRSSALRKAVQDEIERVKREKSQPPTSAKGAKKSGGGGGKKDDHGKHGKKGEAAAAAAAVEPVAALPPLPPITYDADGNLVQPSAEDMMKAKKHADLVQLLTQKYETCMQSAVAIAAARIFAIQAYTRARVGEIKQVVRQMYNHFDYLLERQHQRESKSVQKLMLHLHGCIESDQCLGQLARIHAGNVRLDNEQAWPITNHSNSQPEKDADLYKPRAESKFDTTLLHNHFASVASPDNATQPGRLSFSQTLHNFVRMAHTRYNTQLTQVSHLDQAQRQAWSQARTSEYEKVAYECFGDALVNAPEGVDTLVPEVNLSTIDTKLESAIKRMAELAAGTSDAAGAATAKPAPRNTEHEQARGGSE